IPVAAVTPAAAASAGGPTPPRLAATPPGGPPSFASIIKDARRIDGPVTLWQKEDKVWIELAPEQFKQPFLLSPKIRNGIGEAWVLGGLMALPINGAGGAQVVEFVRVHNQVRMQARNLDVMAKAGTPEALAVAASYSASLLSATPVASAPHPERKSVLVDAGPLFLPDLVGIGMMLQRGLRQGYGLDRSNSTISAARGSPAATIIETQSHFFNGSPSTPQGGLAALVGPMPLLPNYLPDSRSLLVGVHYSLAPLPVTPMATREADPRLGLFTTSVLDFSNDLRHNPRQRLVNRWRLEKKDPAAALSEPVQPITFWIDRNVPLAYRETVRSAILEWNKAFEKVGFQGAIAVQQQPDDAAFDTLDFGYASVRWMLNANPSFGAIGPSHVDPRTGEILDADIAFEGMAARSIRGLRSQVLGGGRAASASTLPFSVPYASLFNPAADSSAAAGDDRTVLRHNAHAHCQHAVLGAEQLGYAVDVLEARGELDPDSPVAQQFVLDYVKDAIMHEVGHALGLRHNFRASRVYTEAQLSDAEFTRANGTTGSVMEYNAVNLPRPGAAAGVPFQTTLGPYDYWAIEYAYKPLPAGSTPALEKAELQRIAARSAEPLLAFGTDEDSIVGLDPETLQLDLGADPIAFAAKRLEIARDLFRRQETRTLPPERDYAVLRRSIAYALNDTARAVGVLVRQIGGVRTLRDFPGSGREPLVPVDAAVQRQALNLIAQSVLSPDGLSLSPALQRRLAPDFQDRADSGGQGTDYSVPERLLELQRAVLGYLMSDLIAGRVLDSIGKTDRAADAFQLSELYARLDREVWADLGSPRGSTGARRELQRDHVNRLASA
ncbi:MAG: zinc-dependent metalloprotease, partial [Chitinophagaceae bacterium]|nr:zinc-dependent metalloprotease [Rubrivivax sp.]